MVDAKPKSEPSGWNVHIPEGLNRFVNRCAADYSAASTAKQKREALQRYVRWLSIAIVHIEEQIFEDSDGLDVPQFFQRRPLLELQAALLEVDNGERPEIFSPTKTRGRPPLARRKQMWWATASALITALMERFGYSEERAARAVARQLKQRKLPLPGNQMANSYDWKQLQSWRDDLLRGKKGKLARAYYDEDRFILNNMYSTAGDMFKDMLRPDLLPFEPIKF
jgi:hypothetical protein